MRRVEPNGDGVRKMAHKVVKPSFQAEEEVGVSRLGHIGNCPVGQNQVETDNGVDGKAVLISLEGVPYW